MDKANDKIIVELYDEQKQVHKYQLLDIVKYDNKEYAVMIKEYSIDLEVEIFKIRHSKDKSATLYEAEKNNYIIMQVYEIFKEKYQKYYSEYIKFKD